MNNKTYHVQLQMEASRDAWWTIARAVSPEGAAEVVRVILANLSPDQTLIRVEIREENPVR